MYRKFFKSSCIAIGAYVCLAKAADLTLPIFDLYFTKELNLPQTYGENSWAVVTGGSRGIGKELGVSLAKRGLNVVLIARNPQHLSEAENEIKKANPTSSVITISYDFSAQPDRIPSKLLPLLSSMDISILVNNVGEIYRGPVSCQSADEISSIINTNLGSNISC